MPVPPCSLARGALFCPSPIKGDILDGNLQPKENIFYYADECKINVRSKTKARRNLFSVVRNKR